MIVARIAKPSLVSTRIIDAHAEPAAFKQSISVNECLMTGQEGNVQLSMLITFAGELVKFEQTRGVALFAKKEPVARTPPGIGAVLTKSDPSNEPEIHGSVYYNNRSVGLSPY